jgi:hypothetical protein
MDEKDSELDYLRQFYSEASYAMGPASSIIYRKITDRWIKANPTMASLLPEHYLPERYDEEDDGA